MKRAILIVAAMCLLSAVTATAQESLGDAARRLKKDKKQTTTEQSGTAESGAKSTARPAARQPTSAPATTAATRDPGKKRVYTNDDLPSRGAVSSAGAGTPSAANKSGSGSSSRADAERGRMQQANAAGAETCRSGGGTWKETKDVSGRPTGYCQKCARGLEWIEEGGYCGTHEQAIADAAERCRNAGGTWKESKQPGWIGGRYIEVWCSFEKKQ